MKNETDKRGGTNVLGFFQFIFWLGAIGCCIYACTGAAKIAGVRDIYFAVAGGCFVLALLIVPFKKLVQAAEYYIEEIDRKNEVVAEDKPQEVDK